MLSVHAVNLLALACAFNIQFVRSPPTLHLLLCLMFSLYAVNLLAMASKTSNLNAMASNSHFLFDLIAM